MERSARPNCVSCKKLLKTVIQCTVCRNVLLCNKCHDEKYERASHKYDHLCKVWKVKQKSFKKPNDIGSSYAELMEKGEHAKVIKEYLWGKENLADESVLQKKYPLDEIFRSRLPLGYLLSAESKLMVLPGLVLEYEKCLDKSRFMTNRKPTNYFKDLHKVSTVQLQHTKKFLATRISDVNLTTDHPGMNTDVKPDQPLHSEIDKIIDLLSHIDLDKQNQVNNFSETQSNNENSSGLSVDVNNISSAFLKAFDTKLNPEMYCKNN